MNGIDLKAIFGMKPLDAIQYLEQKGYKIGWDWHETLDAAHARAFTVAKVARIDILQDIHQSLIGALKNGQTFEQWVADITPTLKAKGWWGKQIVIDATGNAQVVQLGSMRRLRIIYDTNVSSAYFAAKEKFYWSNPALQISHPYVRYISKLHGNRRPAHKAMHGRIFRADDPIWLTCKPRCAFGCQCDYTWVSGYEVEKDKLNVESSKDRLITKTEQIGKNKLTGEPVFAQRTGINVLDDKGKEHFFAPDAGFNYDKKDWVKPFTPPPLDTLPRTFPAGRELPPLPTPEVFPAHKILPKGLTDEAYVNHFLDEFNATLNKPVVHFDKKDEPLVINKELFKDKRNNWKIQKNGREAYLRMLAEAIKNPDEIWLHWQAVKSQPYVLRRRYIKRFSVEGSLLPAFAAFDEGKDGWMGVTIFQISNEEAKRSGFETADDYINAQRGTFLLYSREEDKK